MLQEDISARFTVLERLGICNLKDMATALSDKRKIAHFAQESGLPEDYLTNLKRQTLIYTPKPIPLVKFPDVNPEHVERLAAIGIKQTQRLFEQGQSGDEREALSDRGGRACAGDFRTGQAVGSGAGRLGWPHQRPSDL